MSDHYYSKKPTVQSEREQMNIFVRGTKLNLLTDRGVFSKKELDFGSRLLIETFEYPDVLGPLLDVGCGYGPVGLTLALGDASREVHMVDVNERALELSKENAKRNQVTNVSIYESFALDAVDCQFASVITNPPIRAGKQTIFKIYEQAFNQLMSGGTLWVVIQKKQGAPSTQKKMQELFGNVETVAKERGYSIFRSQKIDV